MIPESLLTEAEQLLALCRSRGIRLATVESCTGGLIAAVLTAIAGASDVVDRGFVTYTNDAKHELAGVPLSLIEIHGAVSEPVARAMAEGGLSRSRAGIVVSATGLMGPGGGSLDKPAGLVWFGLARAGKDTTAGRRVFAGDRASVRAAAVGQAFAMIRAALAV